MQSQRIPSASISFVSFSPSLSAASPSSVRAFAPATAHGNPARQQGIWLRLLVETTTSREACWLALTVRPDPPALRDPLELPALHSHGHSNRAEDQPRCVLIVEEVQEDDERAAAGGSEGAGGEPGEVLPRFEEADLGRQTTDTCQRCRADGR